MITRNRSDFVLKTISVWIATSLLLVVCTGATWADDGGRALVDAAIAGDLTEVQRLLDEGISPNARPPGRLSALGCAVSRKHKEIIKYLIHRGADLNVTDSFSGITPLMSACLDGDLETVQLLLAKGAETNLQDNIDGSTALSTAVDVGQLEITRLLLDHGANVNLRNHYGQGALSSALSFGHYEIARFLVQRGATMSFEEGLGVLIHKIRKLLED